MSDIRDRLNALLIAKFDLEPGALAADPTLESLDFDSLAIVQLTAAMEREFGVEVDDEKLTEDTTVCDIAELLGATVGGAARLALMPRMTVGGAGQDLVAERCPLQRVPDTLGKVALSPPAQ